MNNGELWALIATGFILLLSVMNLLLAFLTEAPKPKLLQTEGSSKKKIVPPKASWSERLSKGLEKSRSEVWGKLSSLISSDGLSDGNIEEVEEILYSSDMGAVLVDELIESLRAISKSEKVDSASLKNFLFKFLKEKLDVVQKNVSPSMLKFTPNSGLKVIMIVGVNGAGKTTTIGKLATKLKGQGAKVVVGACDTFRAAAVDQLQVWCDRAQVEMIRANEGNDPSGVAYDTLAKAQSLKADYCLLDTAGRLHTAANLMEELKKSKRVLSKLDDKAPHEVLLVIDAITGQNALRQAEEFHAALGLTGLVFTKCDGSSKAGNAVTLTSKLQVPITYIGVGESVEDLDNFESDNYLKALLGMDSAV